MNFAVLTVTGILVYRTRDVTTGAGDTLDECYKKTMARLEQITQARYQVEVQWECDFDKGSLAGHPQLKTHPIIQHSPLNTRDALYRGPNRGHAAPSQDQRRRDHSVCRRNVSKPVRMQIL